MTSTTSTSTHAVSADGTRIGYEVTGAGPTVILVDGALCHRGLGSSREIAAALDGFTVVAYDRRGRGASGAGTAPYAPERELEDLAAVLEAAGGEAVLVGQSSGAVLATDAVTVLPGVTALVAFEPPLVVDPDGNVLPDGFRAQLQAAVDAGRPGDAVTLFLRHVGLPAIALTVMRRLPIWRRLSSIAHTLPHDIAVLGDTQSGRPLPVGRWSTLPVPAVVLTGGKARGWMTSGNRALADVLGAEHDVLPGQSHNVKPAVLAAAVTAFLSH